MLQKCSSQVQGANTWTPTNIPRCCTYTVTFWWSILAWRCAKITSRKIYFVHNYVSPFHVPIRVHRTSCADVFPNLWRSLDLCCDGDVSRLCLPTWWLSVNARHGTCKWVRTFSLIEVRPIRVFLWNFTNKTYNKNKESKTEDKK